MAARFRFAWNPGQGRPRGALALWLAAGSLVFAVVAAQAAAASYEFLAAPETDLNRIYRLDRARSAPANMR